MQRPLTGSEPGLLAAWNFDGTGEELLRDITSHGNDGWFAGVPSTDNRIEGNTIALNSGAGVLVEGAGGRILSGVPFDRPRVPVMHCSQSAERRGDSRQPHAALRPPTHGIGLVPRRQPRQGLAERVLERQLPRMHRRLRKPRIRHVGESERLRPTSTRRPSAVSGTSRLDVRYRQPD